MATKTGINISTSFGAFVILAVVTGILAAITTLTGYTTFTPYIILGAIITGITAGIGAYATTGNIPGTPVPLHTLLVWIVVAGVLLALYLIHQTTYDTSTIIIGVIYFLTTLLHEIQTGNTAPTPSPPAGAAPH